LETVGKKVSGTLEMIWKSFQDLEAAEHGTQKYWKLLNKVLATLELLPRRTRFPLCKMEAKNS